jgi:hypothetical protein
MANENESRPAWANARVLESANAVASAKGYVFVIRSERLICREVQVNLAYRWFCKLGIEDAIPDHSVFSRARNERFREADVFRSVFERVVEACLAAGLVGVKVLPLMRAPAMSARWSLLEGKRTLPSVHCKRPCTETVPSRRRKGASVSTSRQSRVW